MELIYSNVNFFENTHTYVNPQGRVLQGITGVLSRKLFQNKYSNVPNFVLEKAAAYGSHVHKQCQEHDLFGIAEDCIELNNYIRIKNDNDIDTLVNEFLVSDNEHYATQIDMIDTDINLYDYKTTSVLDKEYLSWQLSINAYLFEKQNPQLKVRKLYAIWLRKEKSALVEIDRKSIELVKALLQSDIDGTEFFYKNPNEVIISENKSDIITLTDVEFFLIDMEKKVKEAKAFREKVLEKIATSMAKNDQKSIDTDNLKITRILSSTKKTFDAKTLEKEQPLIYAKYIKDTFIKESLRITVKKQNYE